MVVEENEELEEEEEEEDEEKEKEKNQKILQIHKWWVGRTDMEERSQTYDKFYQKPLENFLGPQTDSAVSDCSIENEEQVGVLLLLLTSQVDRWEEDKTEG